MDKIIVTVSLFFFLNLTTIQTSNSSTPDVDHLKNLINQKQFKELEKLRDECLIEILQALKKFNVGAGKYIQS